MVLYSCPRCGFSNTIKTKLKSHFLRKNLCSPSLSDRPIDECYKEVLGLEYPISSKNPHSYPQKSSLDILKNPHLYPHILKKSSFLSSSIPIQKEDINNRCQYCDKSFSSYKNKWRHEKSCKEKPGYTKEEVDELLKNKDALLEEKDKIMDELKKQIEVLLTKVGNTTNNTTNNTYNTIVINPFGNENTSYIKGGFIKELISRGIYTAIPKLLKELHFNPEHKENHNVMIPNRKESYAKRYNGEKWELADKNLTLEDMSDKAFNVLTDYGSGKKFDKFYNEYDDRETGLLKKMKRETEMMILNNQNIEN